MTAHPARRSTDVQTLEIAVRELTAEAFLPFGHVSSPAEAMPYDFDGGVPSICHVRLDARPFDLAFLGRHVRSTQTYVPVGAGSSILVVAPPADLDDRLAVPDPRRIAAFRLDGTRSVTLARGAWHRAPMPVGRESHFVVIDREGTLDDLDLVDVRLALGVALSVRP